jgi:hypothetical protein
LQEDPSGPFDEVRSAEPVADRDVAFGSLDGILIMAVAAPPSVAILDALETEMRMLEGGNPEGVSVVIVRERAERANTAKVDADVRARAAEMVRRARVRGLAYVMPARGLGASLVRIALAAGLRAAPFPARVFDDVEGAVAWTSAMHPADASELLRLAHATRARLAASR